ncbi:MAG: EamA family transporter [Chromatiales bacterium]
MANWLAPALLSALFYGLWSFFPKITLKYVGVYSAIIYEVAGALIVGVIVLSAGNHKLDVDARGMLFGGLAGFCALAGGFSYLIAAERGNIALVATVSALYPIVTLLLAALLLGEVVTLRQGIGIALALVAIYLVSS